MKANWGLVLVPPLILAMAMLIFPQVVFLRSSFFEDLGLGYLGEVANLGNYALAFQDSYYLDGLKLNFYLSVTIVLLTVSASFPVAYTIARMNPKWAMMVLAAIVVSAFVSVAMKVLGFIILFSADGPMVRTLRELGILSD